MNINNVKKLIILIFYCIFLSTCSSNKALNNYLIPLDKNQENHIIDKNSSAKKIHFKILKLMKNNIIYFDLNKFDIKSEFYPILNKHISFLLKHPCYITTIEGHTDERGTYKYNKILGKKRATSISNYLQENGVSKEQIIIISYGKDKPLYLDHDEEAYSKNRRSTLIY